MIVLSKASFLNRSLYPHGADGVVAPVPADVKNDLELDSDDVIDIEYDRDEGTMIVHFKKE